MTTLKLNLPDDLAQRAGLLTDTAIQTLLEVRSVVVLAVAC